MVFSSIEFLFFFLPVSLGLYFLVPARLRNLVLLVSSLVFYIWGARSLVWILFFSILVDYSLGWLVSWAVDTGRDGFKRLGVALSLAANLGLLAYFKYANFGVAQLNGVADRLGFEQVGWTSVILPIGISFFTFQSMSYTIDVARGRCRHLANPIDFALYVALFPQLIAGPIVRFHEISEEIRSRSTRLNDFATGVLRFTHGLAKKVIVADAVAEIADGAFGAPGELTFAGAWIGAMAYTIQIYFDFSGYSDMAIGLGRMLGFRFPENFNRPYSAYSITDFWRRWHITLSNWFRDYLYVPLGGSRVSTGRMYTNLFAIFFTTGLWHGANWTFIVWGMFHGMLMLFERLSGTRYLDEAPAPAFRRLLTIVLVMVGWVMFRAASVGDAFAFYSVMFNPFSGLGFDPVALGLGSKNVVVLILAMFIFVFPRGFVTGTALANSRLRIADPARLGYAALALPYCAMVIASGTFSPFLYFQF